METGTLVHKSEHIHAPNIRGATFSGPESAGGAGNGIQRNINLDGILFCYFLEYDFD